MNNPDVVIAWETGQCSTCHRGRKGHRVVVLKIFNLKAMPEKWLALCLECGGRVATAIEGKAA